MYLMTRNQQVTVLEPGKGYWMKHIGNQIYNTGDEWPSTGLFYVANFPIQAHLGWNIIGVYNYNVPASGITTTPAGLQTGFVFGFSPSTGYSVANTLKPGYGYLIFLSNVGFVNLPDSGFGGVSKIEENIDENWGRITVMDNKGKSSILYAVKNNVDLDYYQLPVSPPSGTFDIRYSSNRFAEDLSNGMNSIEMSGIEYPVKIRVENININIADNMNSGGDIKLKAGEEITISNSLNNKLLVSEDIIPDKYGLEQNYPNPFNPGTTISFSIPEKDTKVKLSIYDALGEKITELVNSNLDAGTYNYYWDARNYASGIYIYELLSEKFVLSKKMMLLK